VSAREAATALSEGNALRMKGRVADAVAAYRRAVDLAPGFAAGHYNLAIALREHGDLRAAALAFRAAARLDPDDMDAVQNVVETLGLAADRDLPRLFAPPAAPPAVGTAPVSIVVCSIDPVRLEAMQASYRRALGPREHEFVVIRDARSLCEGYERGLATSRHDAVVFSHDDVELASDRPFEAFDRALAVHDVVGVAGSRLLNGPGMTWAGQPHLRGAVAYPPQAVPGRWKATIYSLETGILGGMQALDGLVFAARREAARKIGFDAATFDGFHFYDVDFAYRAHLAGLSVAVTTELVAVHASEGQFDEQWRRYAARFQAKFPALASPMGKAFYFGREFDSREAVLRFYDELSGLGAAP
jgi:glycosyl transferase family 2/tetratricopeptide repeat protein